jgi:hypothetical protein
MKLLIKIKKIINGGIAMMINYFAMQVQLGWITLEQVPKRYRDKVRELVELADIGSKETGNEVG